MASSKFKAEQTKINKEIEKLRKRAETLQARSRKPALDKIVRTMQEYSITPEDIEAAFGKGGRKASKGVGGRVKSAASTGKNSQSAPKYRDPVSGKTWTGRGKPPNWIIAADQAGKSRDSFLIKAKDAGKSTSGASGAQVPVSKLDTVVSHGSQQETASVGTSVEE